jgi:hypothetical protein
MTDGLLMILNTLRVQDYISELMMKRKKKNQDKIPQSVSEKRAERVFAVRDKVS